jgi:hypothetical protein
MQSQAPPRAAARTKTPRFTARFDGAKRGDSSAPRDVRFSRVFDAAQWSSLAGFVHSSTPRAQDLRDILEGTL